MIEIDYGKILLWKRNSKYCATAVFVNVVRLRARDPRVNFAKQRRETRKRKNRLNEKKLWYGIILMINVICF